MGTSGKVTFVFPPVQGAQAGTDTVTCQKLPCDYRQIGHIIQRGFPPSPPSVLYSRSRPLPFPYLMDAIMFLSQHRHLCEEPSPVTAWVSNSHSCKLSSQYPVKDLKHPPSTAGMMNQAVRKVSDEASCPEL